MTYNRRRGLASSPSLIPDWRFKGPACLSSADNLISYPGYSFGCMSRQQGLHCSDLMCTAEDPAGCKIDTVRIIQGHPAPHNQVDLVECATGF